jgi:hypothetical protein
VFQLRFYFTYDEKRIIVSHVANTFQPSFLSLVYLNDANAVHSSINDGKTDVSGLNVRKHHILAQKLPSHLSIATKLCPFPYFS